MAIRSHILIPIRSGVFPHVALHKQAPKLVRTANFVEHIVPVGSLFQRVMVGIKLVKLLQGIPLNVAKTGFAIVGKINLYAL